MSSKLICYNLTLGNLGERKLASVSEAREPRRVLDTFWDSVVSYALARGFWNFAMRTVQSVASTSIEPPFGFTEAHLKPTDWVRTYVVSENATLKPALMNYVDEAGYLYCYADPIYWKYVSNDVVYGMDLSLWPSSFEAYVSQRLANQACKRITGAAPSDNMLRDEKRLLANARSEDAMNEPAGFPPSGSWVTSRGGFSSGSRNEDCN
jgi:hypothetical protein